jgi:gliding motility-associated-like protein
MLTYTTSMQHFYPSKRKNFRAALLFAGLLLSGITLHGQNCPNANFSQGNFTNWQGYTGSCCPISVPSFGIINGRHTIMSGAGTDPNTGNQLTVVAPGFTYSARLGNDNTGAQAEALRYTYIPDPTSSLFIYNYAVVLEDPSHSPSEQPRFEIEVRDQFGNVIPCTFYQVAAGNGIPGFQSYNGIRWKDWTTVGLDLTAYIGTPVTIEGRTGDCSLSGHYGYGYMVGSCQPLEIEVRYCIGDTAAVLVAPDGFQSYQWSTGETTQSITINNPTPGTQNITCLITSVTGCQATLNTVINPIIVYPGFEWDPVCNYGIQFTDTSTVDFNFLNQWEWDFGDNNSSTSQNGTHTYSAPGQYDVTLIAISNAGCRDTITMQVEVEEDPIAGFILPDDCGLTVDFIDTSYVPNGLGTITDWDWNFGDNNTDTIQSPTHTYGSINIWDVELVVTDTRGCTDTLVQQFTSNPYPVADFTFTSECIGDSTQFTDQSTVLYTNISDWDWSFGGGGTDTTQSPAHLFSPAGNYNVQLIVSTPAGCSDTAQQQLTVYPYPVVDFTATEPCESYSTAFNNLSAIQFGNINSYTWNFGSPAVGTSYLNNPTVTYPGYGVYNVTLIAVGDNNCTDSITKQVTVWPDPVLDFTADPLAGCWPINPLFDNLSTIPMGQISTYQWTFGDLTSSTAFEPQHLYPNAPGSYTVTLYAVSDHGCDTTITKPNYITVYPQPTAEFMHEPDYMTVIAPETQFINLSVLGNSYEWDFGDGTNSTLENPYHIYPNDTATYPVQLITTNVYGCKDTVQYNVIIHPTFTIYVPNTFTPNADGFNDVFKIVGIGLVEANLLIFDRWGEPLARLDKDQAMTTGWDGTYAGETVKEDVYVYKLSVLDIFGDTHEYHGQINVVR